MAPCPLLPHDLPPLDLGRGLSAGLPSFPGGRHKRTPRSKGGRKVVWGLHRCPLPSLILTLVRAPVRAGHPRHLLPLISHFSWEALLEETNSGRGGNKTLHRLPEHSQGWDISTRGRQGVGGGDSRGQRDREANRSTLLLPFPCSPQPPGHGMGLGLRLLTLFKVSFSLCHRLLTTELALTLLTFPPTPARPVERV